MRPLYDKARLDHPAKQIRLLQYLPQETTSEHNPQYSLKTYDLDEGWPEYIAISYTWGDKEPTLNLTVNGHVMRVRFNCWHALWQLRDHQSSGPIWIDSLCIDQENDVEKSAQVGMMGRIFEMAASVAACIGAGDVLGRLRSLSNTRNSKALNKVLEEINHAPYFNRLWIKQEIILSKKTLLYCGLETLEWEEVGKVLALLKEPKGRGGQSLLLKLDHLWDHHSARLTSKSADQKDEHDTLFDLLQRYGDAQCADPRDKVYALLSLLPRNDMVHQQLPVNYAQSSFDLFLQVFSLCFQDYGSMSRPENVEYLRQILEWLGLSTETPEIVQYLKDRSNPNLELLISAQMHISYNVQYSIQCFMYLVDFSKGDADSDMKAIEPICTAVRKENEAEAIGILTGTMSIEDAVGHRSEFLSSFEPERMAEVRTHPIKVVVSASEFNAGRKYLVSAETRSGDVIARIKWHNRKFDWDGTQSALFYRGKEHRSGWCSHAVLRPDSTSSKFELQSWAIPANDDSFFDTGKTHHHLLSYSILYRTNTKPHPSSSIFNFHYKDVLTFLLLERDALRSLTVRTTSSVSNSYVVLDENDTVCAFKNCEQH
jgi:hypothetical protein